MNENVLYYLSVSHFETCVLDEGKGIWFNVKFRVSKFRPFVLVASLFWILVTSNMTDVTPNLFARYIEDCFCVIRRQDVLSFLEQLKFFIPSIQFTTEEEKKWTDCIPRRPHKTFGQGYYNQCVSEADPHGDMPEVRLLFALFLRIAHLVRDWTAPARASLGKEGPLQQRLLSTTSEDSRIAIVS